uniref:ATPase AAA-type core domain-containing protein n=1 Tax=Clytia hemisphaerica TaxID=252671 RepID=A0A7M5UZG8_9CNID
KELKEMLAGMARRAAFDKTRGSKQSVSRLHMVFRGNPGTGKTVTARAIAGILFDIGLVVNDEVVKVQRTNLIGDVIGRTENNTAKIIEKAMGGVLFVDEAYTLTVGKGESRYFGKKAIEVLMSKMEDNPNKTQS